jgi:hypothetical protein
MNTRAIVMLILALGPAAGVYLSGHSEPAHYLGLGALLAIQLGLLARPVAAFAFLLPLVYAAAAITALPSPLRSAPRARKASTAVLPLCLPLH